METSEAPKTEENTEKTNTEYEEQITKCDYCLKEYGE